MSEQDNPRSGSRWEPDPGREDDVPTTELAAHPAPPVAPAGPGPPYTSRPWTAPTSASLTWADIDATAAYARGRDAARWLGTRPGRTGLVVWLDGSSTPVGPAGSAQ